MAIDLKEFAQLKELVDRRQREYDKATGALEQIQERLKEEFDCRTFEEGNKLLKEKKAEEQEQLEKFNRDLKEFRRKHGDRLEDNKLAR